MDDQCLLRYSRQIMLPSVGYEGQLKINKAVVLIVGVGGLGSPAAIYLAAAGVGRLILCDDDKVELSNLQRQIIHSMENLGQAKVLSARQHIKRLNPDVQVDVFSHRLSEQEFYQIAQQADVIVDCSDNFNTRFMLNRISLKSNLPLVSGAAIKMEGQISVFNAEPDSACYQCLYADNEEEADMSCSENGILAPVVGIIGTLQATETLKIIAGFGQPLNGRLLLLDALSMQLREMKLTKDPHCKACSGRI